jgi:hypothetical protein
MSGKELQRLRNADGTSRRSLACRTFWNAARVEQIESMQFVSDCTVKIYLRALDGALKFRRSTEVRKMAKAKPHVTASPDSVLSVLKG